VPVFALELLILDSDFHGFLKVALIMATHDTMKIIQISTMMLWKNVAK
jgi:hypothetical protein